MALRVAIVGAVQTGFGARSKIGSADFIPWFDRTLLALGIVTAHFTYRQFIDNDVAADAAIFVYQEVRARTLPDLWTVIEQAGNAAEARKMLVVHHPSVGRLVADKTLTHNKLSAAGIPMPQLLSSDTVAPFRVFSNENMASHAPVAVINPGELLSANRFNTEWIDTAHEYEGRHYYICLRAMCVGRHCIATLLRARPVAEGDPSVHTSDTPQNAALLNFFRAQVVVPRSAAISSLCSKIADVLGLGFYSHDILPERSTGRALVCETGFKIYDGDYAIRFQSLRDRLADSSFFSDEFPRKSAERFAEELRRLVPTAPN